MPMRFNKKSIKYYTLIITDEISTNKFDKLQAYLSNIDVFWGRDYNSSFISTVLSFHSITRFDSEVAI